VRPDKARAKHRWREKKRTVQTQQEEHTPKNGNATGAFRKSRRGIVKNVSTKKQSGKALLKDDHFSQKKTRRRGKTDERGERPAQRKSGGGGKKKENRTMAVGARKKKPKNPLLNQPRGGKPEFNGDSYRDTVNKTIPGGQRQKSAEKRREKP